MKMVIFRKSKETLSNVVAYSKHALPNRPKQLELGDIILISQTIDSLVCGQKPIRYRMEFVNCSKDIEGVSKRIWGRPWKYIIDGRNCCELKQPFDIREIPNPSKKYGQGGNFVYVHTNDIKKLEDLGYLDVKAQP